MAYELIGKHILDEVCEKIQEMDNYISITVDEPDDKRHLKDELEQITRLIQFGRVGCNVQPIQKDE